ncbi:WG repeat-containing protein [Ohtaekwangia koreensis]|uniref:WG containing repeat-containing protein n=1 Tax=Ohtaekwangia koreensis TaxID=688867 RepID=A0A1T5MP68_9BACT|nr:WG repeat-containing protein [Ohtaekwangia koreensis]SKC89679.1 WG containing repeat-containing protein [Ohtaekwangia koreensis]
MLLSGYLKAQISQERNALSNLAKQKWARAHEQLRKILTKDSINTTGQYVMARYFFSPGNPDFHLDSAHYYTEASLRDYSKLSAKQREKIKRFPLDSMIIIRLLEQIDSAAFNRTQQSNSETAYTNFIEKFPAAKQRSQAIELRSKAAFADAVTMNTYQAFSSFIIRYPEARELEDAKSLYEKLLFEDKTRDKRLASYEAFLKDYPQTTYRKEAERNIFEISTAPGTIESFKEYLQRYPQSNFYSQAHGLLYYLQADEQQARPLYGAIQNDSLTNDDPSPRRYLVPFLEKNFFGFMDSEGNEIISAEAADLNAEYKCGNIDEDVLVLPGKIVSRKGTLVYKGEVASVDDLGSGFLLIENQHCTKVIHKIGFNPGELCVQDAKVLNGKLLAIKNDEHWSIRTLAGRLLIASEWDNISFAGDVIIFQRDKNFWLATTDAISAIADGQTFKLKDTFEEVKSWPNGKVWARAGKFEGIFDQHLDVVVPFKEQTLSSSFFGGVAFANSQSAFFNHAGNTTDSYDTILISKPWVAAKSSATWRLFRPLYNLLATATYDSISFVGTFAIGTRNDSLFVHGSASAKPLLKVKQPAKIEFIPAQDSSSFFLLEQGDKKTLFNHSGQKLFAVLYDRIQHAGKDIFIVTRKDKKGLVSSDGKVLLTTEYNAIGTLSEGTVSLLKAKKFGLFDVHQKKLIKPEYSKNLSLYNRSVLIALKTGAYGFIGWDNKPLSEFEFIEIQPWNDTLAWVKKNFQWQLYNLKTKKTELDKIRSIKFILDKADDKLAIIQQDNSYGVIHSKRGMVIPLNFSDIVNVGSAERPMYFTEKHVEEASIFVVIYYSSEGKMLRKEIYEQDDYEKIYCANH